MASKNDITGDSIRSRGSSKKYDEGWDRIFGKKNKQGVDDGKKKQKDSK